MRILSMPATPDLKHVEVVSKPIGMKPRKTVVLIRSTPIWKRLFDILGAICLLALLSPALLLVALYIRMVSTGPAIFVQNRLGHGCRFFPIYKFRTMHVAETARDEAHRQYLLECGDEGTLSKPKRSNELIPGGQLLRRFSIDELPQLLNVLIGNMSLVGPRPDVLLEDDYAEWQLRRFEVVPGMTGLWQVSGKNTTTFNEMMELDIRYVDEQSFASDLSIIFRTFKVLIVESNE